ncbi:unnamed protein product [Fusarium graminearum]|nr:unnamed protein product [Fusarium graminearum]
MTDLDLEEGKGTSSSEEHGAHAGEGRTTADAGRLSGARGRLGWLSRSSSGDGAVRTTPSRAVARARGNNGGLLSLGRGLNDNGRGELTSRTVKTARLLRLGVEAVGLVVFRRARFESSTTSISASVTATTTDRLIGLVSGGRTTTEAKAFNRGLDQLVRLDLRLGGGIAGRSQESDRGDGSEKHLVDWDLIVEVEIGLYDLICQTRNKATNRV